MEHKKYWQSLGELKQTEAYEKSIQDEFAEDLIVTEDAKILDAKTPRRAPLCAFASSFAPLRETPVSEVRNED